MSEIYCSNCSYLKAKFNQFAKGYQDLLATKQSQIQCSHRIINQLQEQLNKNTQKIQSLNSIIQNQQYLYSKTLNEKNQILEHYKKRQIDLLEKVKRVENQLFETIKQKQDKLLEIHNEINLSKKTNTKKNNSNKSTKINLDNQLTFNHLNINNSNQNIKNNQENSSIFNQSSIGHFKIDYKLNNLQKDSLELRVCQDKLNIMGIKHKMALLKAIQVITLKQ